LFEEYIFDMQSGQLEQIETKAINFCSMSH